MKELPDNIINLSQRYEKGELNKRKEKRLKRSLLKYLIEPRNFPEDGLTSCEIEKRFLREYTNASEISQNLIEESLDFSKNIYHSSGKYYIRKDNNKQIREAFRKKERDM